MEKIDFKKLDESTLRKEVTHLKKELFNLRLNVAAGEVKDFSQFKKLRKNVARALTFLKKKETKN